MPDRYPQFKDVLKKAEQLRGEDLVGHQRLGDQLSFAHSRELIESSFKLLEELRELDDVAVQPQRVKKVEAEANKLLNILTSVREFSAAHQSGNPIQARDLLVSNLMSAYDSLFELLIPIVAYARTSTDLLTKIEEAAQNALGEAQDKAQASAASLKTYEEKAAEILEAIRTAAAGVGVAQHATHFAQQAEEHRSASRWPQRSAWEFSHSLPLERRCGSS